MFEQFYEFEQTPFSRDIPVEHLYPVPGQEEVLSRLAYAAKMRWFAVLTGECGSGKSTIIRSLKDTLDGRGYRCMYIADSSLTPRHFYNGILSQLGVEGKFYRGDSKRILQRELEILTVLQHITPVIIVDEAHLLEREMLEELRFMLNVAVDSQSPMSLILSGQPELKATLKRQSSLAISQRVNIQCETRYLDVAQTKEYILHQLRYAKSKSDIFSDEAISQIQKYTYGSPREINKLCTHALIYGSQQNKKILDDRCIDLIGKEEM